MILREVLEIFEVAVGERVVCVIAASAKDASAIALAHLGIQWAPGVPIPFAAKSMAAARGVTIDGSLADLRACAAALADAKRAGEEILSRHASTGSALGVTLDKLAAAELVVAEAHELGGYLEATMPTLSAPLREALIAYDATRKP